MDFMDYPCYAGIVDTLDKMYSARDARVARLLETGDTALIAERARTIRERLRDGLRDKELAALRGSMQITRAGDTVCDGYRIENVLLSFMHGGMVPVNVYTPADYSEKLPAIIVSIGHWPNGKAIPENQILCANLARNGFLVATYDPLCQGERRLYDDSTLLRVFGDLPEDEMSVSMHMQVGNLSYLLNKNVAALFVSDSMAVVDYLCTRNDVDLARIGCTGQSGGGTQTLYLSAMDDRIHYVSPIQCISKMRLINPDGIGDCEQSLIGISSEEGFDYPDLLWASFPKPMLLSGALYDSFPLEGARETESEISRLYDTMHVGDRFSASYASCRHQISAETRRFAYEWFSAQMLGRTPLPETDVPILNEELRCFPTDRPETLPQSIYLAALENHKATRPKTAEQIRTALCSLVSKYAEPTSIVELPSTEAGRLFTVASDTAGLTVCKLTEHRGSLLTVRISVNIDDASTDADTLQIAPFGLITAAEKTLPAYDVETAQFNCATVLGRNWMGIRLNHIQQAIHFVLEQEGYDTVCVCGDGICALIALLAAGLTPSVIDAKLSGLPQSLETLFRQSGYLFPETLILPGLMEIADIPELLAALPNSEALQNKQSEPARGTR